MMQLRVLRPTRNRLLAGFYRRRDSFLVEQIADPAGCFRGVRNRILRRKRGRERKEEQNPGEPTAHCASVPPATCGLPSGWGISECKCQGTLSRAISGCSFKNCSAKFNAEGSSF